MVGGGGVKSFSCQTKLLLCEVELSCGWVRDVTIWNKHPYFGTAPPNCALFGGAPDLEKTYLNQWKVFDFVIQTILTYLGVDIGSFYGTTLEYIRY